MGVRGCLTIPHPDQAAADAISIQENPANASDRRHRLALQPGRLWNRGQTLRVYLAEGASPNTQQRVKDLASQWCQYANIKFLFVNALPADIRVSFDQKLGSWSALGTESRLSEPPKATMNFALDDTTDNTYFTNTILHEFGHALGCIHEHQSPAAGGIKWNKPAVIEAHSAYPDWPPERVEEWIFNMDKTATLHSTFDPLSVMMYPIPPEWTTDGFTTTQATVLSANDKAWIAKMYPFDSPGSGIALRAATAAISWSTTDGRVYFQDDANKIREAKYVNGQWSGGDPGSILVTAKPGSPLAVIKWNNGQEIRLYYVNDKNILQEHSYSQGRGWSSGSLSQSGFKVSPDSRLAAICWFDNDDPTSNNNIRIYLQEPGSPAIQAYNGLASNSGGTWNFSWSRGTTLPVGLAGTSIAAVFWFLNGLHIRVYYQDAQLALKSHAWDVSQWAPSTSYNPGTALAKGAIAAIAWLDPVIQIRVYYQNQSNAIAEYRWPASPDTSAWRFGTSQWGFESIAQPGVNPGVALSAVVFGQGHETAIYYQGTQPGLLKVNALLEDRYGQQGLHHITAPVKVP